MKMNDIDAQIKKHEAEIAELKKLRDEVKPWDVYVQGDHDAYGYTAIITHHVNSVPCYILLGPGPKPNRYYDSLPEPEFKQRLKSAGWRKIKCGSDY